MCETGDKFISTLGDRHIAQRHPLEKPAANESYICNFRFPIRHMKEREKDRLVKLTSMTKCI